MAEEDILWGKRRHLFGGIEPSNMRVFKIVPTVVDGALKPKIVATLPTDTIIDSQYICSVGGAVIRRSTTGYPVDEFDGELFADIKYDSEIIDYNIVEGETYYYKAFPYSGSGVYNRSHANECFYSATGYLYGYDLNLSDPNPNTRVTYPADVMNAQYEPACMRFSSAFFDYGDWPRQAGTAFMPKPCIINKTGTVLAYLNPNDYSKTIDGEDTSRYSGYAMMEWPKIYTKRWEENGIYHFRCSHTQVDAEYDCLCNYDKNDNVVDNFYTSIYLSSDSSAPNSKSNTDPISSCSISTASSNTINIGAGWNMETYGDRLLISDLLTMMAKSTDSQTAYGSGVTSGSTIITNGTMDTEGLFYGTPYGTGSVKVFGMENYWGNLKRMIVGVVTSTTSRVLYVKFTEGVHDGTSYTGYDLTDTSSRYTAYYISLDVDYTNTNTSYISKTAVTRYGRVPSDIRSASSSTYECDGACFSPSSTSGKASFATAGGSYRDGTLCGLYNLETGTVYGAIPGRNGWGISFKPVAQ